MRVRVPVVRESLRCVHAGRKIVITRCVQMGEGLVMASVAMP